MKRDKTTFICINVEIMIIAPHKNLFRYNWRSSKLEVFFIGLKTVLVQLLIIKTYMLESTEQCH